MPLGTILWGASSSGYTYANTLTFGYPLYDWVTDRPTRPGSMQIQSPSGTEDSWITGFDYQVTGMAKWIPDNTGQTGGSPSRSLVSGPIAWQDFLDYARKKNVFRFVPNASYPNFYVDGCYLVEPMKGFGANNPRFERDVQLVIRNPVIDYTMALRGIMLEYAPGQSLTDPLTWTFTRADATTIASYHDAALTVQTRPANVLRDAHYIGTIRTTLLEATRVNLGLQSQNFAATWVAIGTPTRVAANITSGILTLDLIGDDDAASVEGYRQTGIAFTGDAVKAVSVYVKQGTSTSSVIILNDTTAVANRLVAAVTWAASLPVLTMTTGTSLGYVTLGNGVFRLLFQTTAVTAANGHRIDIWPATTAAFLVANTGDLNVGGVQIEDGLTPSSYIKTTTVTVTRASDSLSVSLPTGTSVPQASWFYVKFVEQGNIAAAASARMFTIANAAENTANVRLRDNGGLYVMQHLNGTATVTVTLAAAPNYGDTVELLGLLFADGSVQLRQSLNGAADTATAASAANAFANTWSGATAWLNSGGSASIGYMGIIDVKIGSGTAVNTIQAARIA